MDLTFRDTVELAGRAVEAAGVATMIVGALAAAGLALRDLRRIGAGPTYRALRQRLGRAILLGLELLVAADIIGTIGVTPALDQVLGLAVIVTIRTLLSFSLEVELEGRWPWQRGGPGLRDGGRSPNVAA